MTTIRLSNGLDVLVDADGSELASYRWHFNGRYAYRQVANRSIYMHRQIMDAPPDLEVDHINGNRLDNRRVNLRLVTRRQNCENMHHARPDSKTGIRGVSFHQGLSKPWRAQVWRGGRRVYSEFFATCDEAEGAAIQARRKLMTHASEVGA